MLSVIGWILVGVIAGALAKAVVPGREPGGFLATTAIGLIGAVIGGFLWNMFDRSGATGFNLGSIIVAFVGAVVLLFAYHAITGSRRRA